MTEKKIMVSTDGGETWSAARDSVLNIEQFGYTWLVNEITAAKTNGRKFLP